MRVDAGTSGAGAGGTGGDTAADKAYGSLSRQLNLRRIMPGERLSPAAEVADEVGVSRPAVLYAFNRLQDEARIIVRPGRAGVHARPFADSRPARLAWLQAPDRKLDELVAFIELLEPGLARRLAGRGVPAAVLEEARRANEALRAATDLDTFLRAENAFHLALAKGAGAKILEGLAMVARDRLSFAYDLLGLPDPSPAETVCEHEELLGAIAGGRTGAASEMAADHVEPSLRALLDRFGPSDDGDDGDDGDVAGDADAGPEVDADPDVDLDLDQTAAALSR